MVPRHAETTTRLDAIVGGGTLRVGLTEDYRPFSFADASGKVEGIDVDMAMSLAQSLGVKLEIVKTSWSTLKSDLEANSFDIAMGGITITLDRQKIGLFSNPVFSSGKTPITHCGDEPKYETIAAIDQPGVHVIVNPGGTNERFDRAHLQKATIIQWSDNATIFDALVEGKADLMITDAVETRSPGETASRRPMPSPSERAVRPFGTRLLDATRSDLRGLRQSMAQPARPFGRASGDPRPMDALMHSVARTGPEGHDSPLLVREPWPTNFRRPTATVTLLDGDNFNFATIQLHGLTDPLSDKQAGKRGHIGDRSAAGIRLVFAHDPERLAAIIVAQDRDLGAERDYDSVSRFRLRNRARDAFREVAYIPRGQFRARRRSLASAIV